MKPQNSTLLSFGFSYASCNKEYQSIRFCLFTVFLVLSMVSFSKEVTNSGINFSSNQKRHTGLTSNYSPLASESIRTNLYLVNTDKTTRLADGVLTEYNVLFHDLVTMEDAYKFTNINENLGLSRYGTVLAIERRPIISAKDTLYFKLWKTIRRDYQLEFITISLNHPGMQGFLEDAYLGTRTLLALSGNTKVNFTVNADAASANVDRFKIVFETIYSPVTLPVTFAAMEGHRQNDQISIAWKVENELNITKYDVEHSSNGIDFIKINSIELFSGGNANNNYSFVDAHPATGNNFYRIKSVDRDGSQKFSTIIKVTSLKSAGSITIYPNPIKGNTVNLQFTNQPAGIYQVRLVNNSGQLVYSGKFPIASSSISQTIITNRLNRGIYQLEIKAPDNSIHIQKAVVQD